MEVASEVGKELVFGGAAGLVAGLSSKLLSTHTVGLVLGGAFVLMRAAIFDGQHMATWSPLAKARHTDGTINVSFGENET